MFDVIYVSIRTGMRLTCDVTHSAVLYEFDEELQVCIVTSIFIVTSSVKHRDGIPKVQKVFWQSFTNQLATPDV